MTLQRVVIYGGGGLGREVLATLDECARAGQDLECVGFVVDPAFGGPEVIHGLPVYRDFTRLREEPTWRVVVAIGDPAARRLAALRVQDAVGNDRFVSVIHPAAHVGRGVCIGDGAMVLGIASITVDVEIGQHVLINPAVSISHDCRILDYAAIGPGTSLAGGVLAGEGAALGVGVNVAPRAKIGEWTIVGAGSLILSDVPPNCTAVGSPSRIVKHRDAGWHLSPPR